MENKQGVVYILTNPSFPDYVKIGYADDMDRRLKELNRSECIPYAFRVYAVYEVAERLKDIEIHHMIDKINPGLRVIDTFNGKKRKKEFYVMTADDAYGILKTIASLSGTLDRLHKLPQDSNAFVDERQAKEIEENSYLKKADASIRKLYLKLRKDLASMERVVVEPKKYYIAFKAPGNFVDVEVQKHNLKLYLNMKKGTLKDPEEITDDVSELGHCGNGHYRLYLNEDTNYDYVLDLIMQSYKANGER